MHIPLAIESGSRAWGFPSPDSDYDARFVFVRPAGAHLTPWPGRDVIELPIVGELDVNGWELGKAIKLLLKGNAVIIEWLQSPITYTVHEAFRAAFLEFALRNAEPAKVASHYLHLGMRQRRTYLDDGTEAPLKKLFYALRPAAALRWLRTHPGEAVAPMALSTLLAQCEPPPEVAALAAELTARKAVTREMGSGPIPAPLIAFLDAEFAAAEPLIERASRHELSDAARAGAVEFYRSWVQRLDAQGPSWS